MADKHVSKDMFLSDEGCSQQIGTQEVEDVEEDKSVALNENLSKPWGWLRPINHHKVSAQELEKDEYTFGRSSENDVVIKPDNFDKPTLINVISKLQFKIVKERLTSGVDVVFLEDHSTNGTFVDKEKVGKGEKIMLPNNAEIAVSSPHNKIYIFVAIARNQDWIPAEMRKKYTVTVHLETGGFGEVQLAQDKATRKCVAIKKIKKKTGKETNVYNEVKILQKLKHPCVITMENVFESEEAVFIVLEFISGGELSARVKEGNRINDSEAKEIFYQLALALQYLHSKGIAHRDLKPENVLLENINGEILVKVCDFGLSKLSNSEVLSDLKTTCGTLVYSAPEVVISRWTGSYTHKVDVWSLGVLLYLCLTGKMPFSRDKPMPVAEQILCGYYSVGGPEWRGVSSMAAALTKRMLTVNPNERISIEEILEHPWLKDERMRKKVDRLMQSVQHTDENVCPEISRPNKRLKLDNDNKIQKP